MSPGAVEPVAGPATDIEDPPAGLQAMGPGYELDDLSGLPAVFRYGGASERSPGYRRNNSPTGCGSPRQRQCNEPETREFFKILDPLLGQVAKDIEARGERSVRALATQIEARGADTSDDGPWRALTGRWAWYLSRADSARDAVAHAETCGEVTMPMRCHECGHRWDLPMWCDHPLVCDACRRRSLVDRRARVTQALERASIMAPAHWRLRMVTLTVPHEGSTEERLRVARHARTRWCRSLREYGSGRAYWAAALEVTAGDDGQGHVHWHLAEIGPYLSARLVSAWWGAALDREHCPTLTRSLSEVLGEARAAAVQAVRARLPESIARERLADELDELRRLGRIPWSRPGIPDTLAPRRMTRESGVEYCRRRAAWAWTGGHSLTRSVRQVAGWCRIELSELDHLAVLPWAVADVRRRRDGAVSELVKYSVKDAGMPPELRARIVAELWRTGQRRYIASLDLRDAPGERSGEGCPVCGEADVGPDPCRDLTRMGQIMDRVYAILDGRGG